MVTLAKRATIPQKRVLRIIEGAIRNASQVHPEYAVDEQMVRSIAKRATGTLTADWPETLAARDSRRSQRAVATAANGGSHGGQVGNRHGRGRRRVTTSSPLSSVHKMLTREIGYARRDGKEDHRAQLIVAARVIGAMAKRGIK